MHRREKGGVGAGEQNLRAGALSKGKKRAYAYMCTYISTHTHIQVIAHLQKADRPVFVAGLITECPSKVPLQIYSKIYLCH